MDGEDRADENAYMMGAYGDALLYEAREGAWMMTDAAVNLEEMC